MAIDITELTNGTTVVKEVGGLSTHTWEGSAIYDVLVRILNENLKIQYDTGRIKGPNYAEAYIAGLQSCMEQAMKFLMEKDNLMKDIEVKQANIDVLIGQKDNLLKDLEVKEADINLTNRQADNVLKDNAVKEANLLLIAEQKANLLKDLEVKQAGILLTTQQTANLLKDLEVKSANIALTDQQKAASVAQVAIAQAQSTKDLAIKDKQALDITAGTVLKTQQKTALIKDDEVKDANIGLLNRQKDGFDDNKYQKLFEAQMNAWALMFSSGLLTTKPEIISNDSASSLYNTLKPK